MQKNYLIDTNVLLHDPQSVLGFGEGNVVIPIEVIEDLDQFKRDMSELGRNSRLVAQLLDSLREKGHLGEGIRLENGGMLRVICEPLGESHGKRIVGNRVERRLLSLAVYLREHAAELGEPVVVSKSVNLRLKADALGVPTQDYQIDQFPDADCYAGWLTAESTGEMVEKLRDCPLRKSVEVPGLAGRPNEFVLLQESGNLGNAAPGRFDADGRRLHPLPDYRDGAAGITALNVEQVFALGALLDDRIPLVTLTGKAGTGKTLLAIAAGLHKVFAEDRYNRVLVFRPTTPVGRDIGFLPGDVGEKMRPWMQPVYDAVELIRELDRRAPKRHLPPDVLGCEELTIEPLTYIRGRSIPRQFIVIDEAQNLTPREVKTVITRVGTGTKIVLTGDPHQIDNPYVDSLSNGLAYLVDRFRNSELAAHVGLVKGERSQLAEIAANLL